MEMPPPAALLYLDPGSASYLVQLLVGTFFGVLVAVKAYWRRIAAFFMRRRQDEPNPERVGGPDP